MLTHDGLTSVTCTSTSQCIATETGGGEVTFNPALPGQATSTLIDQAGFVSAIACAEVPPQVRGVPRINLPTIPIPIVRSFVCITVDSGGQEVTFNPASPANRSTATIDTAPLTAVSCPNDLECVAVDRSGREVTFSPVQPAAASTVTVSPNSSPMAAVACPLKTYCVAVDEEGSAWEGDPTTSAAWAQDAILQGDMLTGLACRSVSHCVAVDNVGRAFVGGSQVIPRKLPPPAITHLKQSASVWAASGKLPTVMVTAASRLGSGARRVPLGTVFSFNLNEPANAAFTFMRRSAHDNYVMELAASAGVNKVHFYGRVSPSVALKPGRYSVAIMVTNAAGERTTSRTLRFTLVKG